MPHARTLRATEDAFATLVATEDQYGPEYSRLTIPRALNQLAELRSQYSVTTEEIAPKFDSIREQLERAQMDGDEALSRAEYRDAIHTAGAEFHDLKIALLGGELQAWVKEMANPTEQDLQRTLGNVLDDTKGELFSIGGRTTART